MHISVAGKCVKNPAAFQNRPKGELNIMELKRNDLNGRC
jgi:hypothetical protein